MADADYPVTLEPFYIKIDFQLVEQLLVHILGSVAVQNICSTYLRIIGEDEEKAAKSTTSCCNHGNWCLLYSFRKFSMYAYTHPWRMSRAKKVSDWILTNK
ncbi:MAG: hypothetical protein ISR78_01880 [Spirochaetia bacterium]|nr:hypothetical protein [Spirochaetia bacterium]